MRKTLVNATRMTALAAVLGLAAGCATTEQIDEVRAIANNALSEARAAASAANNAQNVASEAAYAAQQAQAAAEAAQRCCDANTDKIDRMFQKAMTK